MVVMMVLQPLLPRVELPLTLMLGLEGVDLLPLQLD